MCCFSLLFSGIFRDYKELPHLDTYSSSQLDDQEYDSLDLQTRLALEADMNRRDQELVRRQGRIPEMFLPDVGNQDKALMKMSLLLLLRGLCGGTL